MGLTIHYRLKFAEVPTVSRHPIDLVRRLHAEAKALSFAEVRDVVHLRGKRALDRRRAPEELGWLLIQAGEHVSPPGEPNLWYTVEPLEIIAFSTWPGEGCEEANVGLARYPSRIRTPNGKRIATGLSGWRWRSYCKTQYANGHGTAHFLTCHMLVIAILDAAKRLGLEVRVDDEGEYWEKRDPKALAQEVASWDEFVAAISGAIKDAGDAMPGVTVAAEIFRRPDFEALEAKGIQDPSIARVVELIRKTAAA